MRPLQQDDLNISKPKRRFRFIHTISKKIVRAETKSIAIKQLLSSYNINAKRVDVRQARMDE